MSTFNNFFIMIITFIIWYRIPVILHELIQIVIPCPSHIHSISTYIIKILCVPCFRNKVIKSSSNLHKYIDVPVYYNTYSIDKRF